MVAGQSCEKCGATVSSDAIYCSACGQRITRKAVPAPSLSAANDDTENTGPQQGKNRSFSYASTGRRIIGGLIDTAIVIILAMIPTILMLTTSNPPEDFSPEIYAKILGGIFGLIVSVAYEALLQSSRHQATIGQRLMKVKVTDLHGFPITLSKALVRTLASCISSVIFKLGYAIQPFTARKQTLHDLAAGTLVLNAKKDMLDSGSFRMPGADSMGMDKESAREDSVPSFHPTESAGISKTSIWNQKRARYYAFGILGLFILIGLLLIFSSKFGLFGPAKYDVYSCPPEHPSSGTVDLWDLSTCKEVPKYTAQFRIDTASSSVYVIYEPIENSSSQKSTLVKLSNCDILDEQNWVCRGKATDLGGVLSVESSWQMVKGVVTEEPAHFRNVYSGKRGDGPMTFYRTFKKK